MKKSTILLIASVIVVAVGAGLLLFFGGKSPDNSTPAKDEQGVNQTDKSTATDSDKIKEEELQGELVASFPESEVPLYPGEIKSSLGRMAEYLKKPEWNVDITTKDSFEDVDAAIRKAYSNDGWKTTSDSKHPLGGFMLIARNDNYIATITYYDDGGSVLINYGVSKQ